MTWKKYLLFQIPEWGILILALFWLSKSFDFSPWLCLIFLSLWVAKDLLLYPFIRAACEADIKTGLEKLVGKKGVTQEHLNPSGYIRIHGELWHAKAEPAERHIPHGSSVEVCQAKGLTLSVYWENPEIRPDSAPEESGPLQENRDGESSTSDPRA